MSENSLLQNGVMFVSLFCLSESIVLLLSLMVLLRKPLVLKKELSKISERFNAEKNDDYLIIKVHLENSRQLFSKQFNKSFTEIQSSRAIFSHYREHRFSSLITLLNVIVLLIILVNLQSMLTFDTILLVFYFSLLGFIVFLLSNLFTVRWLINPKGELKVNIHNIYKLEKTTFDEICSKQIQDYISSKYQTLEAFLEKDSFSTPSFFRINGPKWIDFQKGFIVKDSSLKKILKVIDSQNICIEMDPSSGKTTLANYIGYELVKRNAFVIYISFKNQVLNSFDVAELSYLIQESKSFLILDDVHLNENDNIFKNPDFIKLTSRIILVSRKEFSHKNFTTSFKTQSNLNLKMIEKFISITKRKSNHAKTIKDIYGSRYTLETYSNLFVLGLELDSIRNNEFVKDNMIGLIEKTKTENILLPIAILYQNEIPIRVDYLQKILLITKEELQKALDSDFCYSYKKTNGKTYIGLCDSELAKMLISLYREEPVIGEEIKKRILFSFSPMETHSFYNSSKFILYYLHQYPQEGNLVLSRISRDLCNKLTSYEAFGELLIRILQKLTSFSIAASENMEHTQIKKVFSSISQSEIEACISRLGTSIDIQCFMRIFKNYEGFSNLPLSVFTTKIKESNNISDISSLFNLLFKLGFSNTDKIPASMIVEKIQESNNLSDTGQFLNVLQNTLPPDQFEVIIKLLPSSVFVKQIQETLDLNRICSLLKDLQNINYPLIQEIDPSLFIQKIENSQNLEEISWFLSNLQITVSPSFFSEIIRMLTPDKVSKKIEQCDNLRNIGLLISYLDEIHYLYITKFPSTLFDSKIRMEKNLRDIGMLLSTLKETCTRSSFKAILNNLPAKVFIEKINQGDSLQDIGILLATLYKIQYSEINKIPLSLYISKIQNCSNLPEIEVLLTILHQVFNETMFNHLLISFNMNSLMDKIESCSDLQDVSSFILILYKFKYRDMFRLSEEIFVSKILKCDDLHEIEKLLVTLTKIQFTHMKELVNSLEIDSLREKLLTSNNPEEKKSFINQLRQIEYPYTKELEILMHRDG
ncbi:MAG: ATP-binding protein [Caldisericia bacterium]|nr:ATP-binding protein [Caldisericia bacterium]